MPENKLEVTQCLEISNDVPVMTEGVSMRPMLRQHRDVVVIKRVDRPLKKHDVVAYNIPSKDKLVLHRIIKITRDGRYIIRGDNTYRREYGITDDKIVGVMKCFYREGRYCDPEKSFKYKLYVFFMRAFYPARFVWKCKLYPLLAKVKHCLDKITGKSKA